MVVKIKQNLPDHQKVSLLIIPADLDSELCMNPSYFLMGTFIQKVIQIITLLYFSNLHFLSLCSLGSLTLKR